MCSNINCTQSTPCNSCITSNVYIPCHTCTTPDPCATPTVPCCKVKIESFKCITNAEITSSTLGIQPDNTLDEVIEKIIAYFDTLTGFYKGDKGDKGEPGPRGKRGCRGPAGTGGDSIESVVNNNDGTVTITTELGDVFTFTVSTSGPIVVENTLFVSKLGNDASGLRARFDRHYLTIEAASLASQTGDKIIVYPGDYQENDNPFATDVNYYLHENVLVTCPTVVFGDTPGNAVNYSVRGYGSFYNTNTNVGNIVNLQESFSTIYLRHKEGQGGEDSIVANCSWIDIKGKTLIVQKGKLLDIEGTTFGTVNYENYDASSTVDQTNHIYLHDLTLGDTVKLNIKGNLLSDASADSVVKIETANTSKIEIGLHIKTVASPAIFTVYQDSGIIKFNGSIKEALLGWWINLPTTTARLYVKDAQIQVGGIGIWSDINTTDITVIIEDSLIERLFSSAGEVLTITNSGVIRETNFLISNTRIVNYNTTAPSDGILLTGPITNLQIENSEIYTENSQPSINTDIANNVALLTNLIANYAMDASVTNTVATTSVDIVTTNPIIIEF